MNQVPIEQIVGVVRAAIGDVFHTMLGIGIEYGEAREESLNHPQVDGVVALVGMGGAWTGSGRISCSARCSCLLAGAMLATEFDHVNEEVLDAVAEVANMIIGNVKTHFEETLGPMALSIPTVVFGRNYQTRCSGVRSWTVVPVICGDEVMEVCFFLVQSAPQTHSLARAESSS